MADMIVIDADPDPDHGKIKVDLDYFYPPLPSSVSVVMDAHISRK